MNKVSTRYKVLNHSKVFTQYDDMEPNDLVRKLDRLPSHEFPYTHKFVKVVDDVEMAYVESGGSGSPIFSGAGLSQRNWC